MAEANTDAAPVSTGVPAWRAPAHAWAVIRRVAPRALWTMTSLGLFAGIWEICWALGWADPKLLPPPHIFLGDIVDQAKFFNTVSRWQVGSGQVEPPPPGLAVIYTVLA